MCILQTQREYLKYINLLRNTEDGALNYCYRIFVTGRCDGYYGVLKKNTRCVTKGTNTNK